MRKRIPGRRLIPILAYDHEVPESLCPGCGDRLDGAANPFANLPPRPGAPSMCLNCGTLLVFEEDLSLRAMTEREEEQLPESARTLYYTTRDQTPIPTLSVPIWRVR